MMQPNTNLSGLRAEASRIYFDDRLIAELPAPVSVIARLDQALFVVMNPKKVPELVGVNLWALDMQGNILWKAPDLNQSGDPVLLSYKSFSIFDLAAPKLECHIGDDRRFPVIDAKTGVNVPIFKNIDWSDYKNSWPKVKAIYKQIEEETFASGTIVTALKKTECATPKKNALD